ncbi:MAG: DUF2953 domain-containing protein [Lachnospiraceae bacterium]|nr:DUF2953 domain-containing protein [Lachnospiraceae bacterium]
MQIVLSVLAVLGGILLALLLLVLFLLAALLFVPFRYRIRAEKEAEIKADIRIHWLLHAAAVRIAYAAEGLQWTVRVFGIPIKRSGGKPEKEAETGEPEAAEGTAADKAPDTGAPEPAESKPDAAEPGGTKPEETKPNAAKPAVSETPIGKSDAPGADADTADGSEPEEAEPPKGSFVSRIRKKARELWETARCLYELFIRKKNLLRDYLKKRSVKKAWNTVWDATKWLLLHIAPQKLSGSVVFGSGDPAVTGQAAAVAGMLYPLYGERFSFLPDFEEPGLRGSVDCAGRIRLFGILVRAVRLYRDQNLRNVIREAQDVKEQLLAAVPEMKQALGKA